MTGSPPRFYAPDAHAEGELVQLPADEAEHLTRVLRLKAGAAVRVFNGRGREFDALVTEAVRTEARVAIERASAPSAREPQVAVTLVQAALKGDKMDDVIRDATMMGVAAIQPVLTARSELANAALGRGRRSERWRKIAVSATKQCGRATVPSLLEPCAWGQVTAGLADGTLPQPGLVFVEPAACVETLTLADVKVEPPRRASVLIGPEGGWSSEELGQVSATCRLVTLGHRTIRADAMALVAVTALFAAWGEL